KRPKRIPPAPSRPLPAPPPPPKPKPCLHLPALGAHCLDSRDQEGGSHKFMDSSDTSQQNGKIPNRDSGIDSPSCAAEGEVFPNEDAIDEEDHYDSITETESRDSTQDEDSDLDEGSSGEIPSLTDTQTGYDTNSEAHKCSRTQKLLNIAKELLHTEEAYIKRLHLLDQVFCTKLTESGIPQDVITGIFSNISSIYCFHDKFLLPELKTRITGEWDSNPRIGDILQKLAPFMKMYGEYVKNFDRAMDLVNTWNQRSSQFKSVVQNIQKQDVCGNLTLQHHMLEPVQRIPRYEMLLKDYLKKLPDEALDRKDAEKALELISTAANHSNAAIRKMEKMHKLLEVYERLGGEEDIVNPANELIKEGLIKKMSAKNGTAQDRYLYLFNNMVLYCVPKLRLMGQKFSVRERIDIAGMEVQENVKHNLPFTFAIIGKQRSLELQARTAEEKEDWIQVIKSTIERHKQNSETFNKAFSSSFSREDDHVSFMCKDPLKPPSRKKDKEKQTCKGCSESFNFTKRKHHCKSCGAAICAKCSKTLDNKTSRVCPECFEIPNPSNTLQKLTHTRESCLLCGYLQVQEKGKAWSKMWVAVTKTEPQVLHLQSSGQDIKGSQAVPLPGCEVVSVPSTTADKSELKHLFRLSTTQLTLFLSAQDAELQAKWVEVLSRAAGGESAAEASMSLTEDRKSQ
uniref:Faciogenital dysplasia n=1 Tax=Nothobranchius furzeri TaxID=105023 RepID=A0A8C6Q1K9_NOTFU